MVPYVIRPDAGIDFLVSPAYILAYATPEDADQAPEQLSEVLVDDNDVPLGIFI